MKSLLILAVLAISLFGCKRTIETECGKLRCPPNEKNIYLSVVDAKGKRARASYIETYNTRTGKKHFDLQSQANYGGGTPGSYLLFSNPMSYSFLGDNVTVLIRSESGKEYNLNYLIKGGNCACEVQKLSGPDQLTIE
jgi:hypothetical protein